MKKKLLSNMLIIGLICSTLTGCASFSYGSPVEEDTYVAELPNGETVVLNKEEAEELAELQEGLQEELGISDEELEELREDFAGEEDYEEDDDEPTIENPVSFDLTKELGRLMGSNTVHGITYDIYEKGAVVKSINESFATIPETLTLDGITGPVVGLGDVYDEWTEFTIPSHIKYIMPRAFKNSKIKQLIVPESVIYMSGDDTFYESAIEELSLPNNLRTDSEWTHTFRDCKNLKSPIIVPNDVTYMYATFEECENLTSIQLSSRLETIDTGVFDGCTSLQELTLPNSLKEIIGQNDAFRYTAIKNLILPENLTTVCLSAFTHMEYLEELIIPDSVTWYVNSDNILVCPNLKKIKYSNSAPFILEGYGKGFDSASLNDDSELTIIFPDSLTDLDAKYFEKISNGNITIHVPASGVEYFKNKFPEITVVAKE